MKVSSSSAPDFTRPLRLALATAGPSSSLDGLPVTEPSPLPSFGLVPSDCSLLMSSSSTVSVTGSASSSSSGMSSRIWILKALSRTTLSPSKSVTFTTLPKFSEEMSPSTVSIRSKFSSARPEPPSSKGRS